MKIRIAASLGLLLGVTASALAAEPPSVRLGLPSTAPIAGQRIVRAQDGEPETTLPRLPEPPALPRPLPTLGKPVKAGAAKPDAPETVDEQVTPTNFMIAQSVVQQMAQTAQLNAQPAAETPQPPAETPKPSDAGTSPPKGSDAPPSGAPSAPAKEMVGPAPVFAAPMATSGFCGSDMVGTGCIGGGCPVQGRVYARAEYLLWFLQDHKTPALVTASTPSSGGILGRPGTTVIYGGEINAGEYHGGRLTAGMYVDDCQQLAVEGSFFFLLESDQSFSVSSAGLPTLARPFFRVNPILVDDVEIPAGEDAEIVAFPGVLAGSVTSRIQSKMWGGELNVRKAALNGCGPYCISYNVDALAGFRYVLLEEDLTIREDLVTLAPVTSGTEVLPTGTNIEVVDQFRTRNQFFGGQVGAAAAAVRGPLSLDLRFKLGIGVNRQTVNIDGVTIVRRPDGVTTATNGGLLARPSNIGRYKNEEFSILPEINLNVGYELTEGVRIFAGYTFLYWTNVVRPGDQIDRAIFFRQPSVPLSAGGVGERPAFSFNQRDFWLHGFNVGVELKY